MLNLPSNLSLCFSFQVLPLHAPITRSSPKNSIEVCSNPLIKLRSTICSTLGSDLRYTTVDAGHLGLTSPKVCSTASLPSIDSTFPYKHQSRTKGGNTPLSSWKGIYHMYIYTAESTSLFFSNLATRVKPCISQLVLTIHFLYPMFTTNNQTAAISATSSTNKPQYSAPNSACRYNHSQVFVQGTEHNFVLRSGTCCTALDPAHAALHTRHFLKIMESLNGECGITNNKDFTKYVETICKTHHVKYPSVLIDPTVFETGKASEFSAQLDACDSKNDFFLEIEMRLKDPERLDAAKLMAKDD